MSAGAKATAAFLLLLGLVCWSWYAYNAGNRNGANAELVKSQKAEVSRQAGVIESLEAELSENEKLRKQMADDAKKASKDHEDEIARVRSAERAAAGQRVRIDKDLFCGTQTGQAESAPTGSDGQTDAGAAFLPEPFTTNLRQAAAQADEVSADLRTLKRQAEYSGCFD